MPTILLTNHYPEPVLKLLHDELRAGFEILTLKTLSKDELLDAAPRADYFLASGRLKIDQEVIDKAKRLKMIQRTGVGLDSLDLPALNSSRIPVYINRGVNSSSVAEHTVMLILAVLKKLPYVNNSVKTGEWRKQELGVQCYELRNRTIGLVGLGSIGKAVAKLLQPFGVSILYDDMLRASDEIEQELNLQHLPFLELLKEVDVLSLHLPLTGQNVKMLGEKEIASMKQGTVIINTSRGKLIDQAALVKALSSGHILGAGLDVYSEEPIPKDDPILEMSNVVLTPHIAGVTHDAFKMMMAKAFQNIQDFHDGNLEKISGKRITF